MGVGGSLDLFYTLPGPLPAGTYAIVVSGFQNGGSAHLRFEIIRQHPGAADATIGAVDGYTSRSDDGGVPVGDVGATLDAPAVEAQCGDLLVLRTTFISGSGDYLEFVPTLTVP